MVYELWWRDSLNVAGVFPTEEAALKSLRAELGRHGREYVAGFTLERMDDGGDRLTIAEGSALAEWVARTERQPA